MSATPHDDRSLEERLAAPDAWHRPAAYWFWHRPPEPEEIRGQVRELHDAGIHSFQIQARMAYPIEGYLDEDYLAACRIAVDEAARLGMLVGVYDDYNWQTGHAGGRAVAGHDGLRERQLFWTSGELRDGRVELAVDGIRSGTESLGPAGMSWHYDGGVAKWGDWEIAFAFAGEGDDAVDVTVAARVVDYRDDGCAVRVDAALPEGTPITVFVAARSTTSRVVSFLDPRGAERFVEAGYQPFHDALGDHFGDTVAYFFFDQPHAIFYTWAQHHGDLATAMPYRSELPAMIRRRWPDRHARVMLSLLGGDDGESRALRAQFYQFFSREAMEVFLGELRRWTHEHGVLLSGHEVLPYVGSWNLDGAFGEWDLRVNFGLDHFRIDSYRDLTGADAQDLAPQLSAKLGDSAARANGRSGVIVEQYFARGHGRDEGWAGHWGLSLEELRAQTIRQHLLGMRQLLFHGFYQTDGWDDDPRIFANPRFDFPPGENFEPWFAEHHADFAIESGRLSEFLDDADPACDVAVLYPLRTIWVEGQAGPQAREVGAWAEALADAGLGFHLVDEDALVDAETRGGRVWFGGRGYASLVLPGVTTLRSAETSAAILRLAGAGVRVVLSGPRLTGYQEGPQTAAGDLAALEAAGARSIATAEDRAEIEALALPRTDDLPAVTASAPLRTWAGRCGEEARVVLFNDGDAEASVELDLDPGTPLARVGAAGELVEASPRMVVGPMELVMLVVGRRGAPAPAAPPPARAPLELADGWTLELDSGVREAVDPRIGWERQGHPRYSGIGVYRAEVELAGPVGLELELPRVAGSVTVAVNGHAVGRRGWTPYRFRVDAALTTAGRNLVEIRVASSAANRYYAGTGYRDEPEPAGLLAAPVLRAVDDHEED